MLPSISRPLRGRHFRAGQGPPGLPVGLAGAGEGWGGEGAPAPEGLSEAQDTTLNAAIEALEQAPLALVLCHLGPSCLFLSLFGLKKPEERIGGMYSGVFPQLSWSFWNFCVAFSIYVCRQPPGARVFGSPLLVGLATAPHPVLLCSSVGSRNAIFCALRNRGFSNNQVKENCAW